MNPDYFAPTRDGGPRLYTPDYHRELAAIHAGPCRYCNGKVHAPCACPSCAFVADEQKQPDAGQLSLPGAA